MRVKWQSIKRQLRKFEDVFVHQIEIELKFKKQVYLVLISSRCIVSSLALFVFS